MKEEKEINREIINVLMRIQTTSPELSKYLDEMRFSSSDSDGSLSRAETFRNYYKSLLDLLNSYQKLKGSLGV
jgi:hypothetical protein